MKNLTILIAVVLINGLFAQHSDQIGIEKHNSVSFNAINNMPYFQTSDLYTLLPGITFHPQYGLRYFDLQSSYLDIQLDGISIVEPFRHTHSIDVDPLLLNSIYVQSPSTPNGNGLLTGGIVSMQTRKVQKPFLQMRGSLGDYLSTNTIFRVTEKTFPVAAEQGAMMTGAEYENPLRQLNPVYHISAIGGAEIIKDKLSFLVHGQSLSNDGYLYGREWFLPQGLTGDSALVAMQALKRNSLYLKLQYNLSDLQTLTFSSFYQKNDWDRQFNKMFRYNPHGTLQKHLDTWINQLSFQTRIAEKINFNAQLAFVSTKEKQYVYENPYQAPSYLVEYEDDDGKHVFDPNEPGNEALLDSIKTNRLWYRYFINPEKREGYVHPDSLAAPTSYSHLRAGMDMSHSYHHSNYWQAKVHMHSSFSPIFQPQLGFKLKRYDISNETFQIRSAFDENTGMQIIPFSPSVPELFSYYRDQYSFHPFELEAFLSNQFKFKTVSLNTGVKLHYFDSSGKIPTDPQDPFVITPLTPKNIYWNFDEEVAKGLSQEELSKYMDSLEEISLNDRRNMMQKDASPKTSIDPFVNLTIPIKSSTLFVSYEKNSYVPQMFYLYHNPDYKFSWWQPPSTMGNADLSYFTKERMQIGFKTSAISNMELLAMFFQTDSKRTIDFQLIETYLSVARYQQYTQANNDLKAPKGFLFSLFYNPSSFGTIHLSYTANNLGDETYYGWDWKHIAQAQLNLDINNWHLWLMSRYQFGEAEVPLISDSGDAFDPTHTLSNYHDVTSSTVDLGVSKNFNIHSYSVKLRLGIINLLDSVTELDYKSDKLPPSLTDWIYYDQRRVGTVDELNQNPADYTPPRMIQGGFEIAF